MLFALRLTPLIPFSIVTAAMAMTPIRSTTFILVTFLGGLVTKSLYVHAGTQLAKLQELSDIVSTTNLFIIFILGVTPLLITQFHKKFSKHRSKAVSEQKTNLR